MLSEEGTARLMAFADAVVAIAITLLVLPLVDIPSEADATLGGRRSGTIMPPSSPCSRSASRVIARLWLSHHNMGERMARGDSWMLTTTLVWLVTVVFLPFPTELLGQLGNTRPVAAVYIATFLINISILSLQGRHLCRRPQMWRPGQTRESMAAWEVGWWSNPVLAALALALCVLVPGVGIWALMVLFLDPVITWAVSRRRPAFRRRRWTARAISQRSPTRMLSRWHRPATPTDGETWWKPSAAHTKQAQKVAAVMIEYEAQRRRSLRRKRCGHDQAGARQRGEHRRRAQVAKAARRGWRPSAPAIRVDNR